MTLLDTVNVGETDYGMQSRVPMGTCATPAGSEVKVCAFADNFSLSAGNLIAVTFTYANTYGDGSTTYPKLTINGTQYPVKFPTGEYASSGAWANGQAVTFMFDGTNLLMTALPIANEVALNNVHSVSSNAVAQALGIRWQEDAVIMPSDITSVFNYCSAHFIGSRICAFRISSAGQASAYPFGNSSVTIIYCLSSVNYGWILGLSDNAACQMAIAYINGTVSEWQPISNVETDELTVAYHNQKMQLRKTGKVVTFNLFGGLVDLPISGWNYIGTLPAKYRPSQTMMFNEQTSANISIKVFATNGDIEIFNYRSSQVSVINGYFNGTWITEN